jgi:Gene product 70
VTRLEDGTLAVDRSVLVTDDSEQYRPALDLIDDAEIIAREIVNDPNVMFGSAEHSPWQVA